MRDAATIESMSRISATRPSPMIVAPAKSATKATYKAVFRESGGKFEIDPEIRRSVHFRVGNLLDPGLFDTYIAIDPSLWWNHEALVHGVADRLKAGSYPHQTLYLTAADEPTIVHGTELLASTLKTGAPAGLIWVYEPMPAEHHNTIYRASATKAFRTALGAPDLADVRRLLAEQFGSAGQATKIKPVALDRMTEMYAKGQLDQVVH